MRGDQPVVSAASWIVSASLAMRSTLPRLCQGWCLLFRRAEDRLALLRLLLVEADHRAGRRVGRAHPAHDLARLHRCVALPRLPDTQLGAGIGRALALDQLVGGLLLLAQLRGLGARGALRRVRRLAGGLAQALRAVAVGRLALGVDGP